MDTPEGLPILSQALTYLVALGWAVLLLAGIEPDKPLSGGIPGHVEASDRDNTSGRSRLDRIGEIGAWVAFTAVSLSLPIVLIWVLTSHA